MLKVWLKPHYFVCLLDIKPKLCSSLGVITALFELELHSLLCFFFHLEQLHLVGGGKPLGQYSYWSKYVLWHCTAIGLYPYTPNRVKTICGFTKSMTNCLLNWAVSSQWFIGVEQILGICLILSMWLVSASLRSQDLENITFCFLWFNPYSCSFGWGQECTGYVPKASTGIAKSQTHTPCGTWSITLYVLNYSMPCGR
jgi:hypothetical protein